MAPHRDLMPDLIRAFALFGIALVNVEVFSHNFERGYHSGANLGSWDQTLIILVAGLFLMKSYSLFSMMFGAGLGYQMKAAERKFETEAKSRLTKQYFRRMIGLLVLGLFHFVFLFLGDILITYALLGCILFLIRNEQPKTFLMISIGLLIAQALILYGLGGLMFIVENTQIEDVRIEFEKEMQAQAEMAAKADAAFEERGFFNVALARIELFPMLLPSVLMVQGFGAFAFFLIGLYFQRKNMLADATHKLWRISRWVLMPAGLVLSFFGAYLYAHAPERTSSSALFALGTIMVASPLSTLGYVGWLASVSQLQGPIIRFIARGGSATLSAYLIQSMVMSFVFLEFGLGLYNQLNAVNCVLIGLATAAFSLVFVSIWLKFFKRGPFEILLRRWTYGGAS